MNKLKKGDEVVVLAGRDKGKRGKILSINAKRVVVEGINLIKKHVKPNPNTNTEGGIVERETSLDKSNVALYNHVTGRAGKVGIKVLQEENRRVRYFKSNNELVDI